MEYTIDDKLNLRTLVDLYGMLNGQIERLRGEICTLNNRFVRRNESCDCIISIDENSILQQLCDRHTKFRELRDSLEDQFKFLL